MRYKKTITFSLLLGTVVMLSAFMPQQEPKQEPKATNLKVLPKTSVMMILIKLWTALNLRWA